MKQTLALILIFSCLLFSSCKLDWLNSDFSNSEKRSLDEFDPSISELSTCSHLIPEGFIEKFSYMNGCFFYKYDGGILFNICDRSFIYIEYDDETYLDAKNYVMENLNLSNDITAEYNEYYFYINENDVCDRYPYWFSQFAYNDEKNVLVFFGFYVSVELEDEVDEVADDWPAFLEKYYGEWYSFS